MFKLRPFVHWLLWTACVECRGVAQNAAYTRRNAGIATASVRGEASASNT